MKIEATACLMKHPSLNASCTEFKGHLGPHACMEYASGLFWDVEVHCTDDHSSARIGAAPCPMHGYDDSVPPPDGWSWHQVVRANGQIYTALVAPNMMENV